MASSSSNIPMRNIFPRTLSSSNAQILRTTRRRQLILSYAPDWIITAILAAAFFSLDKVEGYRRVFSVDDTSLRHPFAVHERIPDLVLYCICGVAPLLLQPVINLFTVRSFWDVHNATLGLFLSLATTGSITQFVKITVGRPRPDLLSRCIPAEGSSDPTYGLSTYAICTQTDAGIMRDGFRSFPSGHSSMSFAGLGFLAFYLAGKLHLFDHRGHAGKAWLSISPFAAASLVAISRTMDYRHHWQDVLVGSILGTVMSYFSYRPYSPRIKRQGENILPLHAEDESRMPLNSPRFGHHSNMSASSETSLDGTALDGTVRRDNPPLEDMWREGSHPNPTEEIRR